MTSFDDPFLIATTTLELLHSKSTHLLDSAGPQTAQLSRMGINSLAMIPTETHPAGPLPLESLCIEGCPTFP